MANDAREIYALDDARERDVLEEDAELRMDH